MKYSDTKCNQVNHYGNYYNELLSYISKKYWHLKIFVLRKKVSLYIFFIQLLILQLRESDKNKMLFRSNTS